MINSCVCIEPDEFSETIRHEIRRAQKEHKCGECCDVIKPGNKYEYYVGLSGGDFFVHKTCEPCMNMRDTFFECGWFWGRIWEDLIEHISEEMAVEEQEEDPDWSEYILPPTLRSKHFLEKEKSDGN